MALIQASRHCSLVTPIAGRGGGSQPTVSLMGGSSRGGWVGSRSIGRIALQDLPGMSVSASTQKSIARYASIMVVNCRF